MPIIETPTIDGGFLLSVEVRFDNLSDADNQSVFDFGNGPAQDNIRLGQRDGTADMQLDMYVGDILYSITAPAAIVEGESAVWTVTIDDAGMMSLQKDGVIVAEGQGVVPPDVDRAVSLVGESTSGPETVLIGEISSLTLDGQDLLAGAVLGGADGANTLIGGAGDDTLGGGGGDDTLTGGDGDDTFVLADAPGAVLISDFGAGGAADRIDLSALAGYRTDADVMAAIVQGDGQATLTLNVTGGTQVVTIVSDNPVASADFGFGATPVDPVAYTLTGEGRADLSG